MKPGVSRDMELLEMTLIAWPPRRSIFRRMANPVAGPGNLAIEKAHGKPLRASGDRKLCRRQLKLGIAPNPRGLR